MKPENIYEQGEFHTNNDFVGFCPNCADHNVNGYIFENDCVYHGQPKVYRCIKCKQEVNEKELIPF